MLPQDSYTVNGVNMSLLSDEEKTQVYELLGKYKVNLTQITTSQRLIVFDLSPTACQKLQEISIK